MYRTQPVQLNVDDATRALIQFQCEASNNLYNSVLYRIRQDYFESNEEFIEVCGRDDAPRLIRKLKSIKASYAQLCKQFKDDPNYKILGGQCAQQTIKSVVEAISSYNGLLNAYFKGEVDRPKIPSYRTSRGLAPITFPSQGVKFNLETGECILSMSADNKPFAKEELGFTQVRINGGSGFRPEQVVEVRIVPKLGEFYLEYVYQTPEVKVDNLDDSKALSIDHGRDNWLTCLTTEGKSFILDGRQLKSLNQYYNKRVATIKEGKPQKYWDDELDRITTKRNHQIRDAINKAARFVINHCLSEGIGRIVFGWNPGQKDGSNMGRVNNQQFVQIPTGRLKERIKQLCDEYGLEFVETEEAYTSLASFLDGDSLPRHGEKPSQWKASGKRVKRGMYRSADGSLINADCNGSGNILRKVSTQLGLSLAKVSRAALSLPKRYCIFSGLRRSYRERSETVLQTV